MPSDSSMSGLGFHHAVSIDTNRGHKAEGSEALCDNIRLHITIVVFAGPNETSTTFDNLRHNIINKTMLIPQTRSLHLIVVLFTIDALESVDKKSIILLENGVLARHLEREVTIESVAEASASKGLH